MAEDNFAMGYALGQDSGGNNSGGFGNGFDGIWGIILLAMVLGYGGGGFGFGGFGGGASGALTRAELYDGFATQNIDSAVRGVQQGICDSTYALTNAINGGFAGVDRAVCDIGYQTQAGFNALGAQLAQCCCDNRAAIADLKYDLSTRFCGLGNQIQMQTRDVTDTIRDGFARMEAQANARYVADLERKLNACDRDSALQGLGTYLINTLRPSPIPAYQSCNPWANCGGNWNGCNCA